MKDCNPQEEINVCTSCKKCVIMKYVNFEDDIIFLPLNVGHNEIYMKGVISPKSAGFYNLTKHQVFGESIGLNLKSNKKDLMLIEVFYNIKEEK